MSASKPLQVLFHLNEPDRWPVALGNIKNLLQHLAETGVPGRIELLVNGPAVLQLAAGQQGALADELDQIGREIALCACANALRANGLDAHRLLSVVRIVPVGVVELVERQMEGYAYIKP